MSKVIPFYSPDHQHAQSGKQIRAAIEKVIQSNQFILGKEVARFEAGYANYTGTRFCVGTASGLDALWLSLTALGVCPGDEVIVPSHTCHPTWLAVAKTGATIVPVEPDVLTMNIDPPGIEASITKKTKAIVPVHLYGQACDMKTIMHIARKNNIDVVEDNAQGHGASVNKKMTGSFGRVNATSFYPSKNLGALGDGGAVTTNDATIEKKIRSLRNYGLAEWSVADEQGINSRLDELQAAILNVKLKFLDRWNRQRIATAKRYLKGLINIGDIQLPTHSLRSGWQATDAPRSGWQATDAPRSGWQATDGPRSGWQASHVYHQFVIRTSERDNLKSYLAKKGIGTMIHYPVPPHLQKAYREYGFRKGEFPEAEHIARTCLSLPITPGLDTSDAERVISAIQSYFAR